MSWKAVFVKKENVGELNSRFNPSDTLQQIEEGYWLLAQFGSQDILEGLLDKVTFMETFRFTGQKLANGFFEVIPRQDVPTAFDILKKNRHV